MKKHELEEQVDNYFEMACADLNCTNDLPDVSLLSHRHQKAVLAVYKLSIIIEWVNEGWQPDWEDLSQAKHYPWFEVEEGPAGLGCSYTIFAASYTHALAHFGSRLCFRDRALAQEWGRKLLPLYRDWLLLN